MKRHGYILGVILLLTVLAPIWGWAHKPVSIGGTYPALDQALALEYVDVSQVVYAELSASEPWLWLTFTLASPAEFHTSLGIPAIDRLAGYRPWFALLGPGLPMIDLPVAIPEGYGGLLLVADTSEEPRRFHEPFTGTDSWILGEWAAVLEEPGTYYLLAGTADGILDKLWVSVGRREAFGWRDLLALPSIIRSVREFHEVPARAPGWRSLGKLLFLGLFAAAIALLAGP